MDEPKKTDPFNTNNNGGQGSPGGGVMDIQTPKPADTAPTLPNSDTQNTNLENLETPSTVPLTSSQNTGTGQITPVEETPEATDPKTNDTESAAVTGQTSPAASDSAPSPMAIPPQAAHKSKGPVVAITLALVVALALAGLVVFTYTKGKKNTDNTNSSAGPAPVETKPLASPADVDSTTQELESSLNKIDENKDFSSEELSDKSLGL